MNKVFPAKGQGRATDGPALRVGRDLARERQSPDAVKLTKDALEQGLQDKGISISNKGLGRVYSRLKEEFPDSFKGPGRPKKK